MNYKLPLILTPQAEGGYTVTSPLLPGAGFRGRFVEGSSGERRGRAGRGDRGVSGSRSVASTEYTDS